jgi:hypothetical protein
VTSSAFAPHTTMGMSDSAQRLEVASITDSPPC